jgi:hypothetical protein
MCSPVAIETQTGVPNHEARKLPVELDQDASSLCSGGRSTCARYDAGGEIPNSGRIEWN